MKKLRKQLMSKKVELTPKHISKLKDEATARAIEVATILPLLILRDEFGFGKKRLTQFVNEFNHQLELMNEGRLSLIDIINTINEETKLGYEVGAIEKILK